MSAHNPRIPIKKGTDKSYPDWLPEILEAGSGACIGLAFSKGSENNTSCVKVRPLLCVRPLQSPHIETEADEEEFKKDDFLYNHQTCQFEIDQESPASAKSTDHSSSGDPSSEPSLRKWDESVVPVEILHHIKRHVSNEDIKNLRLVSRAFDRGFCSALFETLVMPFDVGTDKDMDQQETDEGAFFYGRAHHNSQRAAVLKEFGSYVRQFGMTLEVDLSTLLKATFESGAEKHITDWSTFEREFINCLTYRGEAHHEMDADETGIMDVVFRHLTSVKHLALSIDAGHGWMQGPDLSLRSILLRRQSPIFQSLRHEQCDTVTKSQRSLWELLKETYARIGSTNGLQRACLRRLPVSENDLKLLNNHKSDKWLCTKLDISSVQAVEAKKEKKTYPKYHRNALFPARQPARRIYRSITDHQHIRDEEGSSLATPRNARADETDSKADMGILAIVPVSATEQCFDNKLKPALLTPAQRHWLMTNMQAQEAFLSTCISTIDKFRHIKVFTLAKLSSRLLLKFLRHDFWDSLSVLTTFNISVIADWMNLSICPNGSARRYVVSPAMALLPFRKLLAEFIAPRKNITSLSIGWVDGGEHAEGLLARNEHLLPVPFLRCTPRSSSKFVSEITLPHVKRLTIENCWTTAEVFVDFVRQHLKLGMENIVLDSVSLTGRVIKSGTDQVPITFREDIRILDFLEMQARVDLLAAAAFPSVHTLSSIRTEIAPNVATSYPVPAAGNTAATEPLPTMPAPLTDTRDSSWPHVLECIESHCEAANRAGPIMTFRSCGYAKVSCLNSMDNDALNQAAYMQSKEDPGNEPCASFILRRRAAVRYGGALEDHDPLHGSIVPAILEEEMTQLSLRWNMEPGWPSVELLDDDYDVDYGWGKYGEKTKEAAVHDGHRPGGSGRFSGRIRSF